MLKRVTNAVTVKDMLPPAAKMTAKYNSIYVPLIMLITVKINDFSNIPVM